MKLTILIGFLILLAIPIVNASCINQQDIDILSNYFATASTYRADLDLNKDGEINVLDISEIASIFGTCTGNPNYNPNIDVSLIVNQPPVIQAIYPANRATNIPVSDEDRVYQGLWGVVWKITDINDDMSKVYQQTLFGTTPDSMYTVCIGGCNRAADGTSYFGAGDFEYSQTYYWKVIATDSHGAVTEKSFTFTTESNPNHNAPVLNSISDKTVNEGQYIAFTISATDADNDPLTYSASNLPSGASFSGNTFSWIPNMLQSGIYQITFTARDTPLIGSSISVSKIITITVNEAGQPNDPVLTSIGNKAVNEGQTLTFSISATDPNNDPLTYSVSNLPSGASFNSITKTFSWTPSSTQSGNYQTTFTVSDGTYTDSETITITVNDIAVPNNPPILNSIGNKQTNEAQLLQFSITATDADGNALTYSTSNLPSGSSFNTATKTFSWTPSSTQSGTYSVTFSVSDSLATDSETIIITVNDVQNNGNGNSEIITDKLIIEDLDVKVNTKTDTNVLNTETITKKALPGDSVTLKLKIKNDLTEDIEIEDISVLATLRAIDDEEDIEEESSEFNLKQRKSKSISLTLNIPYKVDEGLYNLDIHVEGTDENNNIHETDWTIKLDVEKNKHDLVIYKAALGNEELSCVRTTNLNFEVLNVGKEDEDNVKIIVKNNGLGIDFEDKIKLSEQPFDDDSSYDKTIRINTANVKKGAYPILIEVYRNNILEDSRELTLNVKDCDIIKENKEIDITTIPVTTYSIIKKEQEDNMIAPLIGGIVVVLTLITLVLYFGFRKK